MLWIFVRIASARRDDSNKYPQHMFLVVNKERKKKRILSFIILEHVGILHSDKFYLRQNLGGQMLSLKGVSAVFFLR